MGRVPKSRAGTVSTLRLTESLHRALHPPSSAMPVSQRVARRLLPQKPLPCGYQSLSPLFTLPPAEQSPLELAACLSQWSEQSLPHYPHPFCWRDPLQDTTRVTASSIPEPSSPTPSPTGPTRDPRPARGPSPSAAVSTLNI